MGIKEWPASEQPRQKLLTQGAQSLNDAELLAVFLRTGTHGKSAVDLGRELIKKFGNIRQLVDSSINDFLQIKGLGNSKYVLIQASIELGRRYLETSLKQGDVFKNSVETRQYISSRLQAYPHEVFACLFLDTKHRLIRFEELFTGTIDSSVVYPREILRRAMEHNAAAVVLCHNHPSGHPEPSHADQKLTLKLQHLLEMVDIRVLDHIIVGNAETVSFAERGLL